MKLKFYIFRLPVFLAIIFLTSPGKQILAQALPDTSGLSARVDEYVKQYTALDIFSGVVLIAFDGKPVYHKPFGLADREKNIPVTLNTKFLIGSMNKSFTQVVILQLINEGKLKVDDKMTDLLSGFKQPLAKNITVEQLLTHRSGFGDYHGPMYFNMPYEKKNISGITELLKQQELDFPPGNEQQYSNAGYILLGAIIEKITGKSYAENVNERIIKKLNLQQTFTENIDRVPGRSVGYLKTISGVENNLPFITEPKSDGGFWATAADILTFYRNYYHGEMLLTAEMKKPFPYFREMEPLYAQKLKAVGMAGGMNGANTVHMEMLHEKISVVVLANMDEPVAEKISAGIVNMIKGTAPAPAALPVKLQLYETYKEKGIQQLEKDFESLTADFFPGEPKDFILNALGYELLQNDELPEALEIFTLNTKLFPGIANCWDSYGEALLLSGNNEAALAAYKKALSINPDMPSSKQAVKKLEGK
ncbi:MAG: serine hydrolase domain-containing protein [Chitinophagales bacterium]